jgi:hypothetical protein
MQAPRRMHFFHWISGLIDKVPHAGLVGVILIALGSVCLALTSIFKSRSWVIIALIAGGLLNLLGTSLAINSGDLRNAAGFSELTKIVSDTNQKLDAALKSVPPGSEKAEAITVVRDDFEKSVEDFWTNRNDISDDINPTQLDERSAGVLINRQWRPAFEQALSMIAKAVAAYNKKAGTNIEFKAENIPKNICEIVVRAPLGKVVFREDVSWTISIRYVGYPNKADVPELVIDLDHGSRLSDNQNAGYATLHFEHRAKQFWIENSIYRLPKKPRLSTGKYSMNDFQTVWEMNVVELIGQQDLLLD